MTTPAERLEELASLCRVKETQHGHSYLNYGAIMAALFPEGLTLRTESDWVRFGLFSMQVHKLARGATSLLDADADRENADDGAVYAAILSTVLGPHAEMPRCPAIFSSPPDKVRCRCQLREGHPGTHCHSAGQEWK